MLGKDTDVFTTIECLINKTIEDRKKYDSCDFLHRSKKNIVTLTKKLNQEKISFRVDSSLKDMALLYDELLTEERLVALEKFKNDGSDENDFEMLPTSIDLEFKNLFKAIREKFITWRKENGVRQRESLTKREALLDRLRSLINKGDIQSGFSMFKKIQTEWKQAGDTSTSKSKTLWANYHALVDLFYDQKSIYFKLKELDCKKNLEKKITLCEKTEKLLEKDNVKTAVEELDAIHHEFKNIGPVSTQDRESVWLRFKVASDAIHAKWTAHIKAFRETINENRKQKEKLIKDIKEFIQFNGNHVEDWHRKTRDITVLKKKWEQVGVTPRQYAGRLSKDFWENYQAFFRSKNDFFKKRDVDRLSNLKAKEKLLKEADQLKDSSDWKNTAEKLKKLQYDWKNTGSVPERYRAKIAEDFQHVNDLFFTRQRKQLEEQQVQRIGNFDKKMTACKEIEKVSSLGAISLVQLTDWVEQYNDIGQVSDDKADELEARFNQVVDSCFQVLTDLDDKKKGLKMFEIQQLGLKDDPKKKHKVQRKEQVIYKKIGKEEHDISVFQNNLEFFGRSKNAEKMKDELSGKLEISLAHLDELKAQLKLLKRAL